MALFAGLKLLLPFWREAVKTGYDLIGLVVDFRYLRLHAACPDEMKLESDFYDLVDARIGGPPAHESAVFVQMVNITNFREMFLHRLSTDAEQAAKE